jgi:hypothetical protein
MPASSTLLSFLLSIPVRRRRREAAFVRAAATELEAKAFEVADLQAILVKREKKLGETQKAQAELVRKQRELDDARREMDLTIKGRS